MIHTLPPQPTTFIGRQEELAALNRLLAEPACRLLSLVGPGGIGKTRLAIEVAARHQGAFADGVAFVVFQPACTPDGLVATIAAALDLPLAGRDGHARLLDYLRGKHMLLLLDSMEHMLESVELLPALLAAAPHVKLLVTTREVLNLQEEWRYPLNGLAAPCSEAGDDLERYGAVRLFVERARRVSCDFDLAAERAAVIRICHLVAGMPLALELAAAWTATLPCAAIGEEIARNLSFLESRLRNIPARHRSMRATFEQSWDRLDEGERRVFKWLSVFHGGFTLAAAEMIAAEPQRATTRAILSALVDKSLVRVEPNGRYQVHELLRQYAEAHLHESQAEAEQVYAQHVCFVLDLVEQAAQELRGPNLHTWLERLTIEHDNVRAVLHRAQIAGDTSTVLRLGGALWRFWWIRGYIREGRMWLEQALAQATHATPGDCDTEQIAIRIKALNGAGNLACAQGDYTTAWALHQECLALRRAGGDQQGIAVSLHNLGLIARDRGSYAEARTLFEESLAIKRALGDRRGMSASLDDLGSVLQHQGDFVAARALHEESLAIKRTLGDQQAVIAVLTNLGLVAQRQGDFAAACAHYHEGLAIGREIGDRQGVAELLSYLGFTYVLQGKYLEACDRLRESVTLYQAIGNRSEILKPLEGFACVAGALGHAERSARLFGATEALRTQQEAVRPPADYIRLVPYINAIRAQLGESWYAGIWAAGRGLALEEAIQVALADLPPLLPDSRPVIPMLARAAPLAQPAARAELCLVEELTEREREVLDLIANGQSNQEIASRLVISVGTVKWYTGQIYGKLGVQRRTQAIVRARELQLLA